MPRTYTVKEVADILGYSTNSIYTFLKEKRIRGVRLGKGRFRIPDEELARVLHLSKKPDEIPVPATRPQEILLPDIFDWFVGLSAIVSGVALFLFNLTYAIPAARLILIAAGVGVIATTLTTGARRWHGLFHGVLCLFGAVNAVNLFRGGSIDGAILYGAMAIVLGTGLVWHASGTVLLGLYVSLLAVAFPIWIFAAGGSSTVATAAHVVGIGTVWFGAAVALASVLYLWLFWMGYSGKRPLFILAGVLVAILCVGGAVWYGQLQLWSRAFFLIVLGFFSGTLPLWQWASAVTPRRKRALLHLLFGGVGAVLLLAILAVHLLQQNLREQSKTEFINRIATATNLLISAVDSTKSSLVVSAANPDLQNALDKKDVEELVRFSKVLYETNTNIRRVVFLDAAGDGVALYPYGTFDRTNYADREYFKEARDTKTAYVSNVFQAAVDQAGRQVFVVAVPIFSAKNEFVGVMAGSVDLERLGYKLRQLAVESRGEYFLIVDSNKKILSHPDSTRIGSNLPSDDLLYRVADGKKGVAGGTLPGGLLGLVAYGSVDPMGWTVTLRMPVAQLFALTADAAVWVFGTVAAVIAVSVWLGSLFGLCGGTPKGSAL